MNLELAKTLYFRELDGKVQQDGKLGTYAALLSALGAALAFVMARVWPSPTPLLKISLALSVVSVILFFIAVVWLFRAMVGSGYELLPLSRELLGHWEELSAYYSAYPSTPGSPADDFDHELLLRLTSAASTNALNNRVRSARFDIEGRLLLAVVVLTGVAVAFVAVDRVVSSPATSGGHVMADTPKPTQPASPTTPPPGTPPPAPAAQPPKPVMPQNVIVKGGRELATPMVRGSLKK
jgi:hypothetical protein